MKHLSSDTFFNGRITVKQDVKGYRFSIDAAILAWHSNPVHGDKIVDLGTGCGIVPLILAFRHPETEIIGIEIQEKLADLASSNVIDNSMENRVRIVCKDMTLLDQKGINGPCDLIVTNPPYRKAESGRINPDTQKAVARHEIYITLSEIVETARRLLRTGGRFVAIYSSERLTELMIQMHNSGIEPKSLRMIHAYWEKEAKLFVIEGIHRGNQGLTVLPPLVVYKKQNVYTDEVEKMFEP